MKRILLFAFLMLVVSVNAQFNKKSKDLTEEQFNDFATEIIKSTGKEFIFKKEDKKDQNLKYYYINKNDSNEELIITVYTLLLDVTNTSKGWLSYNVNNIYGKISTIFPIWQKYVIPNASLDYILNNEVAKSNETGVLIIKSSNDSSDFWKIRL